MFVWLWRLAILILACAGVFCIIDSRGIGFDSGIYAEKDKRYFIALNNRQFWLGVAERRGFPWRNPDGPFDDTNVAGAMEKAAFSSHWKFGRTDRQADWVPLFVDPNRPHRFSFEAADLVGDHINYPDELTVGGVNATSRSVGCALLVLPAAFLALLIGRIWSAGIDGAVNAVLGAATTFVPVPIVARNAEIPFLLPAR